MSSGSAAYRLSDDEIAVEHIPTGQRWVLRGRQLDIYRALSYARGQTLRLNDLMWIVWHDCATHANVHIQVSKLRRIVAPDVVDSVGYPNGYRLEKIT